MSNPKGRLGEYRARDWAIRNGWHAVRTATKARDLEGQPDVVVNFHDGQRVLIEAKNRKDQPPKKLIAFVDQSEGYCRNGEIAWLFQHIHGTSRDLVTMEKANLERSLAAAYQQGRDDERRARHGAPFVPVAPVDSSESEGLGHRVS